MSYFNGHSIIITTRYMKMIMMIKNWMAKNQQKKQTSLESQLRNEARQRYNIVKEGEDVYLTMDGERISGNVGRDYQLATSILFDIRGKYVEEKIKEYQEN